MKKQIFFLMIVLCIGLVPAQGLIPPTTGNITINNINQTILNGTDVHNNLSGLQGGGSDERYHLNFADFTEVMTDAFNWITSAEAIALFNSLFAGKTTDDLTEGSTNLYDNQSWNATAAAGDFLKLDASNDPITGDLKLNENFNVSKNITVGEQFNYLNGAFDKQTALGGVERWR